MKGIFLYALYGATSGEVSRAKLDGAINQAILAIIPNDDINANFSEWFRKRRINHRYISSRWTRKLICSDNKRA